MLPTRESRACPPKTEGDAQQALIRLLGSSPLQPNFSIPFAHLRQKDRQTEGRGVHTPAAGLSSLACPAPCTQTGVQASCCWRVLVLALSFTSCISLASFSLVFTSLCVVFPRLFLCFLPREAAHHYGRSFSRVLLAQVITWPASPSEAAACLGASPGKKQLINSANHPGGNPTVSLFSSLPLRHQTS